MSALIEADIPVFTSEGARPLVVSETFGPTFQGEGPSLGRRCSFLRLGGCNLACSWCDTPYTWDWTGRNGRAYDPKAELKRMTPHDVWLDLESRGADVVVITGGEPLLQQAALLPLLERCRRSSWWIEIETAGTIQPLQSLVQIVDQFNVSPKLDNSGNSLKSRYRAAALSALAATGKAVWKFVATEPSDLAEIADLVERHHLQRIYVMPEGVTPDAVSRRSGELAESVLAHGWNLTTRLHVLLYGNRRGV